MTTDTDQAARPTYRTLADFMKARTPEQIEEYRAWIKERLGFDPLLHRDRGIGVAESTRLAGVKVGTGTQWRRRTLTGKGMARPFVEPKPNSPTGKPLFDPLWVAGWLEWTGRRRDATRV